MAWLAKAKHEIGEDEEDRTASDGEAPMTSIKKQITEDIKAAKSSTSVVEAAAMFMICHSQLFKVTHKNFKKSCRLSIHEINNSKYVCRQMCYGHTQ